MKAVEPADPGVSILGRYTLHGALARGGMATVHVGRLNGPAGFARTVAIKRLHPQFATDPEFVSMFVDEARLAARVHSPHVVQTVDVVATGGELFLVMDYVAGESLARLIRSAKESSARAPVAVAVSVMCGVLRGLHAAHEARSERGEPLGIVHRDVSPQNILVGADGLARVLDFGVAKATGRLQTTRDGQLKGKLSYMAPEQLRSESVTRQADVYAASVVLWEMLTGERLFASDSEGGLVTAVLLGKVLAPSRAVAKKEREVDEETMHALERVDPVVLRGLERDPARRFEDARAMAAALEACVAPASAVQVAEWVERVAGPELVERAARVAAIESAGAMPLPAEAVSATEAPTQASSISVSKSVGSPDARREHKRARVVLAAGAVLAVIGVALIVRSTRAPEATAPSTSPATSAAPPLPPDPTVSAAASANDPPIPTPTPTSTPSATLAPRPTARPPKRAAPRDCNPPFTWNSQGKKLYKPECL